MVHEDACYLQSGDAPSKRAILRAALTLFASRGFAATSVREIAKESGYTNPALYRFFKGKKELAGFLFERCHGHLRAEIAAAAGSSEDSSSARLSRLVRVYVRLLDEDLECVVFVHETLRSFWQPEPGRESIFGIVRGLLADAVATGDLQAGADAPLMATVVVGAMAQFARSLQFGEVPRPARAHAESLEQAIRRAVGLH